ncbi:hypothetical protein CCAX7_15460 [Capsulimonas corticalis]|uniref:Uncharacterized protein n=1 Tax=Capsulimonas corticalis TaxID=2219043 RepID=A0A9N7Q9Q8_9BACT|nr:hypothetical protein CCAX7_15460 [Capsulimonas corticalis]
MHMGDANHGMNLFETQQDPALRLRRAKRRGALNEGMVGRTAGDHGDLFPMTLWITCYFFTMLDDQAKSSDNHLQSLTMSMNADKGIS